MKECDLYTFDDFEKVYKTLTFDFEWVQTKRKSKQHGREFFCTLPMGFDCETTRVNDDTTFCYVWQFSIANYVIISDLMSDFNKLIQIIKEITKPRKCDENDRYIHIIFDLNLSYEFQFFKHYWNVTDCFFKEKTAPMYIELDNSFRVLECISWGGSLSGVAKTYTSLVKLKGDLDFSIYRESWKDFTKDEEYHYICFDVLILSEFAEYYFNTYLKPMKFTPLSLQNYLRKLIEINGIEEHKSADELQITSQELYSELMCYLYRGGYVHADANYSNKTQTFDGKLVSFDKTSSYPWSMLTHKMPISKLHETKLDYNGLITYMETYHIGQGYNHEHGFAIKCTIYDIETKKVNGLYRNNIESKSKIIDCYNPTYDNGRLLKADYITVWLTELDFMLYQKFYDFKPENVIIEKCFVYRLGYLPRYFTSVITKPYEAKYYLKSQGKPYAIEKGIVNSIYGITVTKAPEKELEYNNETHDFSTSEKTKKELYERFIKVDNEYKSSYISAMWGIYTSAWSRYDLLCTVDELERNGNPCVYEDTDSIKTIDNGNAREIFAKRNAFIRENVTKRCENMGLPIEVYAPEKDGDVLGAWDEEYTEGIINFKSLGCKRYLIQTKDHIKLACSGLKDDYFFKHCEDNNVNPFDEFEDQLKVEECKKTHKYVDEEKLIQNRDGTLRIIPSNCTLNDSDFTLTVTEDYKNIVNEFETLRRSIENSILNQTNILTNAIMQNV